MKYFGAVDMLRSAGLLYCHAATGGLQELAARERVMSTTITDWLKGLGLEQYEKAFHDNDIDHDILPELTADALIGPGVASIGHRRKLLAAIKALHDSPAAAAAPPASAADAAAASVPAEPAGAERRLLTIMFCDLVG